MLAPAAVTHQSGLLGFAAAAALFGAVGFSVVLYGMMWTVGFGDADAMAHASATAGIILALMIGLRVSG